METIIKDLIEPMRLYSHLAVISERLTSPEKELRGSPTTAEDKETGLD